MRSATHRAMTCLNFVPKVGELRDGNLNILGGGMWLWGADQLVLWEFYNEKNNSATFYWTWDHNRDMTQPILALNLVFIGKWPMHNLVMTLSTCITLLNDKRGPSNNTTLGSRESLIPEPSQHLPQFRFQWFPILCSWFTNANLFKLLMLKTII